MLLVSVVSSTVLVVQVAVVVLVLVDVVSQIKDVKQLFACK
jgi:hypothetical protein